MVTLIRDALGGWPEGVYPEEEKFKGTGCCRAAIRKHLISIPKKLSPHFHAARK